MHVTIAQMKAWDRVQQAAIRNRLALERQAAVRPILAARAEKKAVEVKQGRLFDMLTERAA